MLTHHRKVNRLKILLISPCHKNFGGWYRTENIRNALSKLNHTVKFVYNQRYHSNKFIRILIGLRNAWFVALGNYDVVHIFELLMPETLPAVLIGRLLRKRMCVDVGDEWTYSPTYRTSGAITASYIRFFDHLTTRLSPFLTTTSEFLKKKYSLQAAGKVDSILVLNNYINCDEYKTVSRKKARGVLHLGRQEKIVLAFGNTYGGKRQFLFDKTVKWVSTMDKSIRFISGIYLDKVKLPLFVGACDLFLFPTGDNPCEEACYPIRVGTYLHGERVIATDESETEFHNSLMPFNCLLTGRRPYLLAKNIVKFFNDRDYRSILEFNVLLAKKAFNWDRHIRRLDAYYTKL